MALDQKLLDKTKEYATGILANELPDSMLYHDLNHTLGVVEAVKEIGAETDLTEEELEIVLLAAWLHDIGYSKRVQGHEEASIDMSRDFLLKEGVDAMKIAGIVKCIEATKMPQHPLDLQDRVICDADLYHLSTADFQKKSELLRQECEKNGMQMSVDEWQQKNMEFMQSHEYYTDYGVEVLSTRKSKNLKEVKKRVKDKKGIEKYTNKLEAENRKLRIKLRKDKEKKPERGIETMFRITSKNHLTLSDMADKKANIMISVNAIILSILGSVFIRKLDDFPNLLVPALLMTLTCLLAMVFAILATRPNVITGTFTREDIMNKKTNLLFFGNFSNMGLTDYMWAMRELMKDGDYLYGSLIKDIYFLGIVLGKKYKMLRLAYTIFMYGFVISIISFILAAYLFAPESVQLDSGILDDLL